MSNGYSTEKTPNHIFTAVPYDDMKQNTDVSLTIERNLYGQTPLDDSILTADTSDSQNRYHIIPRQKAAPLSPDDFKYKPSSQFESSLHNEDSQANDNSAYSGTPYA